MDKVENRICWYSAVLIALMVNSAKMLALRETGIIARYWHFDPRELCFQVSYSLAFCYAVFYLNLRPENSLAIYLAHKRYTIYFLSNFAIIISAIIAGSLVQYVCFASERPASIFFIAYVARYVLSSVLIGIIIKIILLLREGKKKDRENNQLKSAYMAAELELLKEQINPHFLFNSLSSLSGVIRENPDLAQRYVRELSNVFRYSLVRSRMDLVTLEDELIMLRSFAQLVNLRVEGGFHLDITLSHSLLSCRLPHLSLQPLLENAVKHNVATVAKPLTVKIYESQGDLIVSNNVSLIPTPETSNGVGLANLNERFKIMLNKEIEIISHPEQFIVKLPLA